MAEQRKDPSYMPGWLAGMNNIAPDFALPDGTLRNAVNVDIFDSGMVRRRKGFTEAVAGTDAHSLWATDNGDGLVVIGDNLYRLQYISGAWTTTSLDTGYRGRRVWYVNLNGETWFSNGVKNGIYASGTIRDWGLETPAGAPAITSGTGNLPAGRYQVALTYLSSTYEESGASAAVAYTLSAEGGLFVTNIPQPVDSTVAYIRIYLTPQNGDVFYSAATVAVGATSQNISNFNPGPPLRTQFMSRFPACTHLEYWNGKIFGADGEIVWHTEPLRYGLYDPSKNFLAYSADASVIKAVPDGVYIAAEKTWFVTMDEGGNPVQREVLPYGAVSGTAGNMPDSTDVFWFSTDGYVVASAGGQIKNIMSQAVAVDEYTEGVSMLRDQDGVSQLVCSLTGKGDASALTCTDYAEAEIIRRAR